MEKPWFYVRNKIKSLFVGIYKVFDTIRIVSQNTSCDWSSSFEIVYFITIVMKLGFFHHGPCLKRKSLGETVF